MFALKINIRVLFSVLLLYVFAFQRALISISNIFSYVDELFAIFVIIKLLFKGLNRKLKLNKAEVLVIAILIITTIIGVFSNIHSKLLTFHNLILLSKLHIDKSKSLSFLVSK